MKVADSDLARFVVERGAVMLETTNEWEVMRFQSKEGVGVVYKNKYDKRTYTGTAIEALEAYKASNNGWNVEKTERTRLPDAKRRVVGRDGITCFYCGKPTDEKERTLEHVLSITSGGNNTLDNLAIACYKCNQEAGSLSVVEKVKLRDKKRQKRESAQAMLAANRKSYRKRRWLRKWLELKSLIGIK